MDKIRTGWRREFFQAPNEIYDRRDINGYAKAVFVYLCRRADDDSRAFPTHARIASDVGFSESTVRRAIDILTEIGLLVKEARYDGRGFQTSNLYTLVRPSTVPERGPDGPPPRREAPAPVSPHPGGDQGVLQEQPGCSGGTGGVLCENTPGGLVDQPGCSEGTGRVVCGNSEEYPDQEYPDEKYPGEKDPSVSQSTRQGRDAGQKRRTERQIDFSDPEQVIKYYTNKLGATRRQVTLAMLSVQAQLDKGTVIMDYKAYFEKTLTQLLQEEDFRRHFV